MKVPVEEWQRRSWNPARLVTLLLLLFGAALVGIGWIVGVTMLWASPGWSRQDKVLGTLLIPGGLPVGVALATFGIAGVFDFTDKTAFPARAAGGSLQIVAIGGPLYMALQLGRHLRDTR